MRLSVAGVVYVVHLTYEPYQEKQKDMPVQHRQTTIRIHPGKCVHADKDTPCTAAIIGAGQATTNPKDMFSREVGRKLAFGRAISFLDDDLRKKLWQEYLTQFPPRSVPKAA